MTDNEIMAGVVEVLYKAKLRGDGWLSIDEIIKDWGEERGRWRMKEPKRKGLMTILAVALVLGLATSALAAGKLSFGVKGGMGLTAPVIKSEDGLTEDWNDMVDDINQELEDAKDLWESMGGTASINLAEKITRGWDIEGYAQYRITEMFGLRGSVGYLTGMKSDFGYNFSDLWSSWYGDFITEKNTASGSASCLFISLGPILTLRMGNFLLTFGGGPGYYMGKNSLTQTIELSGDSLGTLWGWTTDLALSGSKIGFRGFLEGAYSTGSLTIGAELGYRSTGEIETTGELTTTGEDWDGPVDETQEITGKLDFSGLYILLGIGFTV